MIHPIKSAEAKYQTHIYKNFEKSKYGKRISLFKQTHCGETCFIIGNGPSLKVEDLTRLSELNIPLFWKNIIKMSLAPAVMIIAGIIVCQYIVIDSCLSLFVGIVIYLICYVPIVWFTGLNEYEKNTVKMPVQNIINKIRRK